MSDAQPRLREDLLVHAGFVHALARATLRGDSECEDLEQDVWTAALVGAPAEPGRQRPWLVSVLRRRAADLLRRRSRRERRERASATDRTAPSAADSVARAESGRRLVEAVLALDEPYRTAVLLRFQDGLPPRDVAARTGVPVETARSRVRRGLERLRTALDASERRDGRSARGMLLAIGFDDRPGLLPSALVAGGLLVTKKMVACVVGALVLAGTGFLLYSRRAATDADSAASNSTLGRSDAPTDAAPGLAPAPASTKMAPDATPSAAAAATDATSPKIVRGRLVGDDGQAIVGAVIRSGPQFVDMTSDAELLGGAGAVAWPTARTDADGRFEMPGADRWGGGLYVYPHASGWCLHSATWMSGTLLYPGTEATIHLARGVPLDVRVIDDATGNGIGGATVAVYRSPGYLLYIMHADDEATADETGRATLTVGGGDVRVVASAPGFAMREGEAQNVGTRGASTTVRLLRGGGLDVEIVDGAGHAVAGARAVLLRASALRVQGVSDAKGIVRFEHVPPIEPSTDGFTGRRLALVAANAEGFARTWIAVDPAPNGERGIARLVLARPRTLAGRVRYRDGSGASGLLVRAGTVEGRLEWGFGPQLGAGSVSATTVDDGRFELPGVTPGPVTLVVGPKQAWKDGRTIDVPADGELPVVELTVDRDGAARPPIRVRVLDFEGRGVANARVGVVAQQTLDYGTYLMSGRMTSVDGSVEVEPAEAGPWWLTVDSPKSGPILQRLDAAEVARGPIDVRPAEGRISGRATRLDGSPARARLMLVCRLKLPACSMTVGGIQGAVETDADGRFAFVGVSERVDGIQSATPSLTVLSDEGQLVRAGRTDLHVVLIDESEAAGLRIEVEVLDSASRAALVAAPEVQVSRDFAAGYAGAWLVPGSTSIHRSEGVLAPGTWHVRVMAQGYETQETDVTVTAGKTSPRVRVLLEKSR